MLYIRPVEKTDLDDLLELSVKAGKGMSVLGFEISLLD